LRFRVYSLSESNFDERETHTCSFLFFLKGVIELPKTKLVIKYLLLLVGLFFMGAGIALTTKSDLGTSPISSLPYVLSMTFHLTFGEFTFLLSLVFLLIEVIILGKEFPGKQYMQLLVGSCFGFFVDLGMFLFAAVNPQMYLSKIFVLLLGSAVLAFGVYLQIIANVLINPGEGVVRTIARKTGIKFGNIKIIFDFTLVATAAIISLYAFRNVKGIREGTILCALLVGLIVNSFGFVARHISLSNKWLEYLADS
jgi:uncharacterized membrane protein YczE